MSLIVAIVVGGPIAIGIGWLVWNFWNSNRLLDSKLATGDMELLTSSNYKVSEVIRAPAGSRVEKVAPQQIPFNQQGYIRQQLPDGRIALIPVGMHSRSNQSIRPCIPTSSPQATENYQYDQQAFRFA